MSISQIKPINTAKAPAPIGPYSQAIQIGDLVFVSGQVALIPGQSETPLPEGVENQAHQVMNNLQAILEAAGCTTRHIVKTTIFLLDMADFPKVNEVYKAYLTAPYPARETVAVLGLPKGALVEISCIAHRA